MDVSHSASILLFLSLIVLATAKGVGGSGPRPGAAIMRLVDWPLPAWRLSSSSPARRRHHAGTVASAMPSARSIPGRCCRA